MTIGDFILQVKMDSAQERLLNSRDSITEIALNIGYSKPSWFSHQFKNCYGLTPSEFRKWRVYGRTIGK